MIVSIVSTGLNGSNMTRLLKQGAAGHTVAIVAVSWIENPWARSSRCMATSTPPDLPFGLGAGDGTFTAVAAPAALAAGLAASWPLAPGFAGSCPLGAWLSAGAAATRAVTTDSAAIVSLARMSPSSSGKLRMIGVYVITDDPNNRFTAAAAARAAATTAWWCGPNSRARSRRPGSTLGARQISAHAFHELPAGRKPAFWDLNNRARTVAPALSSAGVPLDPIWARLR